MPHPAEKYEIKKRKPSDKERLDELCESLDRNKDKALALAGLVENTAKGGESLDEHACWGLAELLRDIFWQLGEAYDEATFLRDKAKPQPDSKDSEG